MKPWKWVNSSLSLFLLHPRFSATNQVTSGIIPWLSPPVPMAPSLPAQTCLVQQEAGAAAKNCTGFINRSLLFNLRSPGCSSQQRCLPGVELGPPLPAFLSRKRGIQGSFPWKIQEPQWSWKCFAAFAILCIQVVAVTLYLLVVCDTTQRWWMVA